MNTTKHFSKFLTSHIRTGSINVYFPDSYRETFGTGHPQVDWVIHNPQILEKLHDDPITRLGESYVAGEWETNDGGLRQLLAILLDNLPVSAKYPLRSRLMSRIAHYWERDLCQHIPQDVTEDQTFLHSFLDQDLHFSAGYFIDPHVSLEEAQRAKCRHIMKKLRLEPGQRVLVAEETWQPLALYLAEHSEAHITALVNSASNLRAVQEIAAKRNLLQRITFVLEDIWQHRSKYDRVVSIGILEQLPQERYVAFFQRMKELLHAEGIAVMQATGRAHQHRHLHPWLRKHTFNTGNYPSLTELVAAIEEPELMATDIEILRFHHALTLSAWQERFHLHRAELAERFSEHFCRLWEFSMAAMEINARHDLVVFQIQLAPHLDTVPITRQYLYRSPEERPDKIIVQPINGNLRINLRK